MQSNHNQFKRAWYYLDLKPGIIDPEIYLNICWESNSCGNQEDCPDIGWHRVYFQDISFCQKAEKQILKYAKIYTDTIQLVSGVVQDPGWRSAWHRFFKPIPVGNRFMVLPSWETVEAEGRIPIRIRPGQAFGTGYHESTALCLKCMEELDFSELDVLDAGCGSGILCIAAAKLGARSVTGIDHEDEAAYEAAENAALNGVAPVCRIISGKIETFTGVFDCFIGNVHAEFFEHQPGLPDRLVRENGVAILSGFTSESLSEMKKYLIESKFSPAMRVFEQGEWRALFAQKTK